MIIHPRQYTRVPFITYLINCWFLIALSSSRSNSGCEVFPKAIKITKVRKTWTVHDARSCRFTTRAFLRRCSALRIDPSIVYDYVFLRVICSPYPVHVVDVVAILKSNRNIYGLFIY